jgi:hypothetical protein
MKHYAPKSLGGVGTPALHRAGSVYGRVEYVRAMSKSRSSS